MSHVLFVWPRSVSQCRNVKIRQRRQPVAITAAQTSQPPSKNTFTTSYTRSNTHSITEQLAEQVETAHPPHIHIYPGENKVTHLPQSAHQTGKAHAHTHIVFSQQSVHAATRTRCHLQSPLLHLYTNTHWYTEH